MPWARDKLEAYMQNGGYLIISAGNLAKLPGGLAGQTNATALVTTDYGPGRLTIFATDFGVGVRANPDGAHRSENDRPLPKPYEFRPQARKALDEIFRRQALFDCSSSNLSLITCRKAPGEFTLGIANNTWRELPLKIVSHCGSLESVRELLLDQSEKGAVGYLPEGIDTQALGRSTESTIAGGDVRLFAVRVKEAGVVEIPHVAPPTRPRGRVLPLRRARSIKDEILARPTLFEHFDGVVVDWRCLHEREKTALQREAGWIRRQSMQVYVDLSSGVNLYPALRLIDNLDADYSASMAIVADVLSKMEMLGARDLILSLHRHPENNFSGEQTQAAFEKTLRALASQAAGHQVTLHLRMAFGKPPWSLGEAARLLDKVGAQNLRLAASTALLPSSGPTPALARILEAKLGLWLVAAPGVDIAGKLWDAHAPVRKSLTRSTAQWIALSPETPLVLDGIYASQDEEYLDVAALERLMSTLKPNR